MSILRKDDGKLDIQN